MATLLDNSDLDSQNTFKFCCSLTILRGNLVGCQVPLEHINQECDGCKYSCGT